MKKNIGLFMAALIGILICFTLASAYRTGGEFASDSKGGGNPARFTPNFAPRAGIAVSLAHKGVYNLNVEDKTAVRYYFLKTSDKTSTLGKIKFGTVTTWNESGTLFTTTSPDTVVVGKDVKTLGFSNFSTGATTVPSTLILQYQ